MPEHHTGEGLFVSARALDSLEIFANDIHFIRDNNAQDWAFGTDEFHFKGSKIVMTIDKNSTRHMVDIFKASQ